MSGDNSDLFDSYAKMFGHQFFSLIVGKITDSLIFYPNIKRGPNFI